MTAEHFRQSIAALQRKLHLQEGQVADTKRLINLLRQEAGEPPLYAEHISSGEGVSAIRPDQYYGRPLATVIREYLQMRRTSQLGTASVNEIYEALKKGGYSFQAKNDENCKRGLQISLSKNQIFHRIPNGTWGLSEWFPTARVDRAPGRGGGTPEVEAETELEGGDPNA